MQARKGCERTGHHHVPILIAPFLQFSSRRDLREIAKRAWDARGANGGEHDNLAIAQEILTLRQERAGIVGIQKLCRI